VEFAVLPMQYISQAEALAQAAELLDASALFAQIASGSSTLWGRFQRWNLKRQLGSCRLYTLGEEQPYSIAVQDEVKQIAVEQR